MKLKKPTLILTFFIAVLSGCSVVNRQYTVESPEIVMNNRFVPNEDLIGETKKVEVQSHEKVTPIAERYSVGFIELRDANRGKNLHQLVSGTKIVIPKSHILPPQEYRKGIVINLAEMRLYYFNNDGTVDTFPVAIGRDGWHTPLGKTYVYRKEAQPTWWVPKSIRDDLFAKTGVEQPAKIPPGPENPLGDYAIYLAWEGYLVHGTNNPASIGHMVSSGCIRMFNENVAVLFEKVNRGTPVNIIYYPVKAGWQGNNLFLEAHEPPLDEGNAYSEQTLTPSDVIEAATEGQNTNIDWRKVQSVIKAHTGIPTVVGSRI